MSNDSIDEELLRQQEEEQEQQPQQEENDNLGSQFEAGGNGSTNDSGGDDDGNNRNRKKIELAFKKAEEIAKPLFKDQYGVCYGWLDISGHKEVLKIESGKFKRLLFRLFYNNVGYVPSRNTIDNWVHIFQALADFEGPTYPLASRVTLHNGDIYYDLTNETWQCVRISSLGWEILDSTPIPLFVRHNQTAQILPNRNYEPEIFDGFLGKDTVRKVEMILQKAPHELLEKARRGQWAINKVYKKLQNQQMRQDLLNGKKHITRTRTK